MKILYIPIDERPCNYQYPLRAVHSIENIQVESPTIDLLGEKKKPADTVKLWNFIFDNIEDGDILILSTETMMYGGLIPSRLHHFDQTDKLVFLNKLKKVKSKYPNITIFLSNMIMRTPQYNSSDEEPDYYEHNGLNIFNLGVLLDKGARGELDQTASDEVISLKQKIGENDLNDFVTRRKFNKDLTLELIELVENGVIDFMVIPQDDSHQYGFTAMDQSVIYPKIREKGLSQCILVYPGADEVGYELLARGINQINNSTPKIYVTYSSVNGPSIVPTFEDREIAESLKSHVLVTGSRLTCDINEADFVLAYNTPGKKMMESSMQLTHRDLSFDRNRNIPYFVEEITDICKKKIPIAICDKSFSNGGDLQLLELLSNRPRLWSNILSYRGWNTNCNALGSALAEGIFGLFNNQNLRNENLFLTLCDDLFYQPIIRGEIAQNYLSKWDLTYFDLKDKQSLVIDKTYELLTQCWEKYFSNLDVPITVDEIKVLFPWNRMFEVYVGKKNA